MAICLVAALLLGACTADRADESTGTSDSRPREGGTLTIGVVSSIVVLDPQTFNSGQELLLSHIIADTLFELDENSEIIPRLGTQAEPNDDGTKWRIDLREGVEFHDGSPLTPQEVVASFERLTDPDLSTLFGFRVPYIKQVKASGSSRVIFTLDEPVARFDQVLADFGAKIIPESSFKTADEHPIGTGPFMFESLDPGNEIVLTKNPNYWEEDKPYLDRVVIRMFEDPVQREEALKAEEIDVAHFLPVDSIVRLRDQDGVTVTPASANTMQPIVMDSTQKPFDDPKVREAMQYLVDREELAQTAFFGQVTPVNGFPERPDSPYYPSDVPIPEQDLERVGSLLAESKYPNGFEVTFYYSEGFPEWRRLGEILRQDAEEVGITISLQAIPREQFFDRVEFVEAFYLDSWIHDPSLDLHLTPFFDSQAGFNLGKWKDPEIDRLLVEARRSSDPEEARSIYGEFTKRILADGPYLILYVKDSVAAFRDGVGGFKAYPDQNEFHLENVWLDESK